MKKVYTLLAIATIMIGIGIGFEIYIENNCMYNENMTKEQEKICKRIWYRK